MRLPRIVSFLLWAFAAFAAVGWVLHWPSTTVALTPQLGDSTGVRIERTDLLQLLAPDTASVDSTAAQPLHADAPGLQLDGIVYSSAAQHSRAIVQRSGGALLTVGVGHELPGGWRLAAIAPRHITLERQGQQRQLHLPQQP